MLTLLKFIDTYFLDFVIERKVKRLSGYFAFALVQRNYC